MFLCQENLWTIVFASAGVIQIIVAIVKLVYIPEWSYSMSVQYFMFGAICFLSSLLMIQRRLKLLGEASEAVKQDQIQYDDAWGPIKDNQEASLRKLALLVGQHRGCKREQRLDDSNTLYRKARSIDHWYQSVVHSWAAHCDARHQP